MIVNRKRPASEGRTRWNSPSSEPMDKQGPPVTSNGFGTTMSWRRKNEAIGNAAQTNRRN
jgi:hypothetical protein